MSTTTTPNLASQAFQGIANVIKQQIASLAPDEILACGPAIVTFFTWTGANPQSLGNPLAFGPQLALLQAALIAAQTTVTTEVVQSSSNSMVTLMQNMMAAAKAQQAGAAAVTTAG